MNIDIYRFWTGVWVHMCSS